MSIKTEAYRLLMSCRSAVLSSHSEECPGYPFGSVIPYVVAGDGTLLMLTSRLAQHTKNIIANPKASLFVQKSVQGDPQAAARLTVLCDIVRLDDEAAIESAARRFYRYWPSNTDYHTVMDFDFYRLRIVKLRFIAGFAKMGWAELAGEDLVNPLDTEEQEGVITHMNEDHQDAMQRYAQTAGLDQLASQEPTMIGVDANGFDVTFGEERQIVRFHFEEPVTKVMQVRQRMVAMSKADHVEACVIE